MVHGLIMVKQPKLVLSWGRFRTSASTLEQEEQCHQKKPKGGYCIAHTRLFYYFTVGLFNPISFIHQKSDNLQYNTLVCWVAGMNDSSTKCLMFQVLFFFMTSCKILCKNCFNLFSYFFISL